MKNDPNLGLNYEWAFRESGWNVGMDANLLKLGSVVHLSVLNDSLTAPPVAPSTGDRYLAADGAIDEWLNHEREIAIYIDGSWQFYTPKNGWLCWVVARTTLVVYNNLDWHDLISLT
jgi:hypothetical protein